MKVLGLVVSEKKFFFMFYPCPPPRGGARMDPRDTAGRIYKEDHYTLLHTKYESPGPCGFREDFLYFSYDAPGARPVWTPGARLAGFIKMTTIHCYTQNMKALGLVISEKKIIYVLPMTPPPPGRGPYGPQGHGWQDL